MRILTTQVGSLPRPDDLIGPGGRVHPDIAWAKLEALGRRAALASRQLD